MFEGDAKATARAMLDDVGLHVPLQARADSLTVAQKHLLEIAKALALKPRILILDEPTAALDQDATDMLFTRIRRAVAGGTAVIYITHRLAELRQIARRVTVLRDGRVEGRALVSDVTDDDLLGMIVGRSLASAFPPKCADAAPAVNFTVKGLSARTVRDVSFEVGRGQIIGIAGVEGNGQADLMRALAGLEAWQGEVRLNGQTLSAADVAEKSAYMPSDRHAEGIASELTVRENATFSAVDRFAQAGIVSRPRELAEVRRIFGSLAVKAPGLEAGILSLSGGNQQKVVMARALLSRPGLHPGRRADAGRGRGGALRDLPHPARGVGIGRARDRQLVRRRRTGRAVRCGRRAVAGPVAETLRGLDVTEDRIVAAAVKAQSHVDAAGAPAGAVPDRKAGLRQLIQSDNATVFP